jgi:tetratricopeptide (TPR) repeat protein
MRSSLVELGRRLGLPPADDVSQALIEVNDALRTGRPYRRWLLVFDNALAADDLTPFLSNPSGHLLITSRNRNWAGTAETVEVDVFRRTESIELVKRRLPLATDKDADALADKLGDLPLALEQAAAWMLATAMPVAEYIEVLDKRVSRLLAESTPSATYATPVAAVWGFAFEQLGQQTPEAIQLLELCAFFGAEPIAVPILSKGPYAGLPGVLDATVGDDLKLRRAVRDIARYGLAKVDQTRNSIQVHRLVQAVLRDRLTPEQQQIYRRSVQRLLAVVNPGDPTDDPRSWERHAEIGPHVVPSGAIEGESPDIRRVVVDQIRYLYVRGDYESSRELGSQAYSTWREMLGPQNVQTLVAARFLANALRSTGRAAEARELNRDAYAIARRELGENHEHTLALAISVAADLRLFGEWQRARELDEEMLGRHRQEFGDDDSNTLRCANNLAVDFRLLGDFEAAYRLDDETWNRRRRVIGDDHPDTLFTVSSLSRDIYGLGDYARALALQRQWLPVHRGRLGADHSNVLRAARIHAGTLRKAGLFHEAIELSQEVYHRYRRRFGGDHIDTVGSMMTLFSALAKVNRLAEARMMGDQTLSLYRQLLGDEHPFTLVCMTNMAIVLRGLGEYGPARVLDDTALRGMTTVLGEAHPYTICTVTNVSNNLAVARDHEQARAILEPNLRLARETMGRAHPESLACAGNLALDLQACGETAAARKLRDETVSQLRHVMNGTHPDMDDLLAGRRLSCVVDPPTT